MKSKGIVKAVCKSAERGEPKQDISRARFIAEYGMEGDAHSGNWHRQVSLLSYEKIKQFNEAGADVSFGDFGENLIVDGIDFSSLPVGSRLKCGDCVLEITQKGKECHTHCHIYHKMGVCIMPREGVFACVINDGTIASGDTMELIKDYTIPLRAAILTISDKGFAGEQKDKSGPIIVEMLKKAGYSIVFQTILPDEQAAIESELTNLSDRQCVDLVLTTGGTGFSRRDITPEATLAVAERLASGIAEAIRAHSLQITGRAMLSRAVSVIRGGTLIVNLPGSPKAVRESLGYVLPHLHHGIEVLRGDVQNCARP